MLIYRFRQSLFGEQPSPQATRNTSSSLFDEDPISTPQKTAGSSGGLFADDSAAGDTNSPWGSSFTPKKQARADLIKTLLPANAVPESYVDVFDAFVEEGFVQGSGASKQGIEKLLHGCQLNARDRTRISELTGAGTWDKTSFSRGEVNVVLALIGLAQEGEEVSLDSVDERRDCKNMFPEEAWFLHQADCHCLHSATTTLNTYHTDREYDTDKGSKARAASNPYTTAADHGQHQTIIVR